MKLNHSEICLSKPTFSSSPLEIIVTEGEDKTDSSTFSSSFLPSSFSSLFSSEFGAEASPELLRGEKDLLPENPKEGLIRFLWRRKETHVGD